MRRARLASAPLRNSGLKGLPNLGDDAGEVGHHTRGLDAQDAEAEARESAIPAGIGASAGGMTRPIDFDDELPGWSAEVSDKRPEGHLAANPSA